MNPDTGLFELVQFIIKQDGQCCTYFDPFGATGHGSENVVGIHAAQNQ